MKPSEGDIYYDEVFDCEIEVLEIDGDSVLLKDPVAGDGDDRNYRLVDLEHNISVGRFEKVDGREVEFEVDAEQDAEGIFKY